MAQLEVGPKVLASIPQGHYTLKSLAEELTESLSNYKNEAKIRLQTNNPNSGLKIEVLDAPGGQGVTVTPALYQLINSGPKLSEATYVKKLTNKITDD